MWKIYSNTANDRELAQGGVTGLELETQLIRQFGPLIGGSELCRALGFRSAVTFRRALREGRLPVRVFELEGRKGKFALTTDIAGWLARLSDAPALNKV